MTTITEHIEACPLSRAEICARAGISRAMLSLIENGKRKISADRTRALAEVIGVSPETLRPDLAAIFTPRDPDTSTSNEGHDDNE